MKRFLITASILLLSVVTLSAQKWSKEPKNFVKVNIPPVIWKNYSFQYERVITKRISAAVGYRNMPLSSIPFQNELIELLDTDDPEIDEMIRGAQLSNWAITPEVRYYFGKKGYGRGFYLAPYFRYSEIELKEVIFPLEEENPLEPGTYIDYAVNMEGTHKLTSFGLMAGVQWSLARNVSLDWWILGASWGPGQGSFIGTPDKPLPQEVANDFKADLTDEFKGKLIKEMNVEVTTNKATLNMKGPLGGIRSGITIGIKF